MSARRRYRWEEIATMAQGAGGVWRLHPDLVAITLDTLHHMRRRVRALRSTKDGHYEFARGAEAIDDLGVKRFDCFVRWVQEGNNLD